MDFRPHPLNQACRLWQFKDQLPETISIYWLYDTYGPKLDDIKYNKGCYDVSKSRVNAVHLKALGYSAQVDPITCNVPFLEKPEFQCRHNEFTIKTENCQPREGFVYERLLRNTVEYRYFYCRTGQDFYLRKSRKANDFNSYQITDLYAGFQIPPYVEQFCKEFGIDFAELDILVDFQAGNFVPYIVDVNNIAGMGMTIGKFENPKDFHRLNELYIEQIKTLI